MEKGQVTLQVETGIIPNRMIYKGQVKQAPPSHNKKHEVEEGSYMKIRAGLC